MYMKSKKKLEHNNTAWDLALARQRSRTKAMRCLCGQRIDQCSEAYTHITQGY
jgi:hypothetical protein